MSENDNQMQLPSGKGGKRPGSGRPTNKQLDERAEGQAMREEELNEREARLAKLEEQFKADRQDLPSPVDAGGTQPMSEEFNPRVSANEIEAKRMHGRDSKSSRRQMGQAKRLDADFYVEKYPDKKLMWVNDMNGDVQRWIDEGAEPVPVATRRSATFEGITDQTESKWVRAIGGDDGNGNGFWVYLLMMDPATYHELVTGPLQARQDEIRNALGRGRNQSDVGSNMPQGGQVNTYAPNLPTGGVGFETIEQQ